MDWVGLFWLSFCRIWCPFWHHLGQKVGQKPFQRGVEKTTRKTNTQKDPKMSSAGGWDARRFPTLLDTFGYFLTNIFMVSRLFGPGSGILTGLQGFRPWKHLRTRPGTRLRPYNTSKYLMTPQNTLYTKQWKSGKTAIMTIKNHLKSPSPQNCYKSLGGNAIIA